MYFKQKFNIRLSYDLVTFNILVDLGVDSASELNNRPRLNYNLTRIQNRKLRVEHPAIRDLDEHQCYTTHQHFKAVFSNMVRENNVTREDRYVLNEINEYKIEIMIMEKI